MSFGVWMVLKKDVKEEISFQGETVCGGVWGGWVQANFFVFETELNSFVSIWLPVVRKVMEHAFAFGEFVVFFLE